MLTWMMVRYKVKEDRAAENESYVRAVFEQLKQASPLGLMYATFKLDDGVSFMHIVVRDVENNPLVQLPAFQAFTAAIQDRCVEPPVSTMLHEVGSYGLADSVSRSGELQQAPA